MEEVILLFILAVAVYQVGKASGEKQTLITIRDYIKGSKDWEEYDIEV